MIHVFVRIGVKISLATDQFARKIAARAGSWSGACGR
jgi:hypothetical protein